MKTSRFTGCNAALKTQLEAPTEAPSRPSGAVPMQSRGRPGAAGRDALGRTGAPQDGGCAAGLPGACRAGPPPGCANPGFFFLFVFKLLILSVIRLLLVLAVGNEQTLCPLVRSAFPSHNSHLCERICCRTGSMKQRACALCSWGRFGGNNREALLLERPMELWLPRHFS